MGSAAVALAWALLSARWGLLAGAIAAAMIVPAVTVPTVSRAHSVRQAWAWMCVIDGFLSAALAVSSIAAQGAPFVPGAGYEQEMRHAIGPVAPLVAILGLALAAAAVVGAILLILSGLWLFYRDRDQRQRGAP